MIHKDLVCNDELIKNCTIIFANLNAGPDYISVEMINNSKLME